MLNKDRKLEHEPVGTFPTEKTIPVFRLVGLTNVFIRCIIVSKDAKKTDHNVTICGIFEECDMSYSWRNEIIKC